MMHLLSVALGIVLYSLSVAAYSEEAEHADFAFYFSLGQVYLDENKSSVEGVKNDALYIRLGLDRQKGQWLVGGGLSGLFYSDRKGFSVLTESVFGGDVQNSNSSASATNLYLETGYLQTFSNNISLFLIGGYELVLSSSRSIDNCTDCPSQDIDIESGAYLSPRISYPVSERVSLSGNYYHHLSGDVENGFSITVSLYMI